MWDNIPSDNIIKKTKTALQKNNIEVFVVENGKEAKEKILNLIPEGSEVFTMTSKTLEAIGVLKEIDEFGKFISIRNKLNSMNSDTQKQDMKRLGSAPDYTVGSVHAVTQDGKVLIASKSASQLPAYIYGAAHVIWAVGAQKIVKNIDDGMKRIYEYCFPLEDARARKAYGIGSAVDKIVISNGEPVPGRITMILIKEKLGF